MMFQYADGGERLWDKISDIEKAHLFSLFVAITSAPAIGNMMVLQVFCMKIKHDIFPLYKPLIFCVKIPSLTVEKVKSARKPLFKV